jgi:hypothetical protein
MPIYTRKDCIIKGLRGSGELIQDCLAGWHAGPETIYYVSQRCRRQEPWRVEGRGSMGRWVGGLVGWWVGGPALLTGTY